ncbi:protein NO VEIN domain-containing protein [Streptomyces sp. NPDC086010]|uniref:protein NO VEIN domain-containing protein n=1 Tax=Streptomyces sp. NPDC086010 TaxID=3365745 RepID=UPI0037D8353A
MPSLATEPTRRAALRWLSELQVAEVPRVRVLFANHPLYADLTPAQYAEGLAWLRRMGMVTTAGRPVVQVIDGELADDSTASTVPRVLWSQSAEDVKQAIGAAGEQALLRLLREGGVPYVRHVAAESDAFGYDIAAARSVAERAHIEVKATTDPTRLVVHLTRHEYEVMAAETDWCLAAVLVGMDGNAASVATVKREWLHSAVPTDQGRNGRWESVRLTVPGCALMPGLVTEAWVVLMGALLAVGPVWGFQSSPLASA